MLGGDRLGAGEIGDRASDAHGAIVAARGESQPGDRGAEQPGGLGRELTQASELPRREIGVQASVLSADALALDVAGRQHARADHRRAVSRRPAFELVGGQGGKLDLEIDTIEERPR